MSQETGSMVLALLVICDSQEWTLPGLQCALLWDGRTGLHSNVFLKRIANFIRPSILRHGVVSARGKWTPPPQQLRLPKGDQNQSCFHRTPSWLVDIGLVSTCPAQTYGHLISITTLSPLTPTPQSPWNSLPDPPPGHTLWFPSLTRGWSQLLIVWFWFLGFVSVCSFSFNSFYSSSSNNHCVPSFPSCYVLILFGELWTGLLFSSLEFLWFLFCLHTSFFWAKSQASLKPGSASGHSTCSWWAPGKDRQSLRTLMSSSEKRGSRSLYHGAEWGGAVSLARGNCTFSLGCSHPPWFNHSQRERWVRSSSLGVKVPLLWEELEGCLAQPPRLGLLAVWELSRFCAASVWTRFRGASPLTGLSLQSLTAPLFNFLSSEQKCVANKAQTWALVLLGAQTPTAELAPSSLVPESAIPFLEDVPGW